MKQRKASHQGNRKASEARTIRSRANHSDPYLLEEYLGIALPKPEQMAAKRKQIFS